MNIIQEWRNKYGFTQEQGAEMFEVHLHTWFFWECMRNTELPPDIFHIFCVMVGGEYYDYCHVKVINSGE